MCAVAFAALPDALERLARRESGWTRGAFAADIEERIRAGSGPGVSVSASVVIVVVVVAAWFRPADPSFIAPWAPVASLRVAGRTLARADVRARAGGSVPYTRAAFRTRAIASIADVTPAMSAGSDGTGCPDTAGSAGGAGGADGSAAPAGAEAAATPRSDGSTGAR